MPQANTTNGIAELERRRTRSQHFC